MKIRIIAACCVFMLLLCSCGGALSKREVNWQTADLNGRWGEISISEYESSSTDFMIGWNHQQPTTSVQLIAAMDYSGTSNGDTMICTYASSDNDVRVTIIFDDSEIHRWIEIFVAYADEEGKYTCGASEFIHYDEAILFD